MIQVRNLTKTFRLPHERRHTLRQRFVSLLERRRVDTFHALTDVSFDVSRGEFLGIIGRNGSGKSTLLKLLAGVLTSTSGTVRIDGDVAPFLELGVGFQEDLTVLDNIYLYGALLGMRRKDIEARFDWALEFSGLRDFLDAKFRNLSSGMKVRLAFTITVSAVSPVLLVDEVLAVGDIEFQKRCYRCFEDFKREGRTIVFVSHDLAAVRAFCDRVLLLERGCIRRIGAPDAVAREYEASFTSSAAAATGGGGGV